jgi:hypothetical protein
MSFHLSKKVIAVGIRAGHLESGALTQEEFHGLAEPCIVFIDEEAMHMASGK